MFASCPQALLLIGRWMEETAHYAANRAIQQYKVIPFFVLLLFFFFFFNAQFLQLQTAQTVDIPFNGNNSIVSKF